MKLTPWFPSDVKPAYPGVYEMFFPLGPWYRRWDGDKWYSGASNVDAANTNTRPYVHRSEEWRGLAEPPKGWTK